MRRILIDGYMLEFPGKWDELDTGQMEHVAKVAGMGFVPQAVITDLMAFLLDGRLDKTMDGLYILDFRKDNRKFKLDRWQMEYLADALAWMLTPEGKLEMALYRNPYPVLDAGGYRLTGSGNRMEKCVYEQFMYLQFYLRLMEGYVEYMPQALACLWHSGKRFNPERIHADAVAISRLKEERKTVMMWHVWSSLALMRRKFPKVFGGREEASGNIYEEQMKVVAAMSGGDVTKMQEVRNAPLWDALVAMEESIREAEAMDRTARK